MTEKFAANSIKMKEILQSLTVLPVLVIPQLSQALPLAHALARGGLSVTEITLRTDCALPAIQQLSQSGAVVGGGTVTTVADLEKLKESGAHFAVSPGTTPALLKRATELNLPYAPGVSTMSEVMMGIEHGYRCFKFFPAEIAGGVGALKAFAGPFPQISFCPTGGIQQNNFRDYLNLSNVLCVGGSWVAPPSAIQAGDWLQVEKLARQVIDK